MILTSFGSGFFFQLKNIYVCLRQLWRASSLAVSLVAAMRGLSCPAVGGILAP